MEHLSTSFLVKRGAESRLSAGALGLQLGPGGRDRWGQRHLLVEEEPARCRLRSSSPPSVIHPIPPSGLLSRSQGPGDNLIPTCWLPSVPTFTECLPCTGARCWRVSQAWAALTHPSTLQQVDGPQSCGQGSARAKEHVAMRSRLFLWAAGLKLRGEGDAPPLPLPGDSDPVSRSELGPRMEGAGRKGSGLTMSGGYSQD